MPKKKDLNPEKREEICNRLLEILGLDENNCFIRSDMDENEEKQQQIIDMKPEIKEYFACAKIAAFKPNFHVQRPYLSIVKGILQNQGYTIIGKLYIKRIQSNIMQRTIIDTVTRNQSE